MAEIQSVETEDEYIPVRFRDPDRYETSARPTGRKTRPSPSLREPRSAPASKRAREEAREIVEKIES